MNRGILFALIFVIFVNASSQMDPNETLSRELAQFVVDEMGPGYDLITIMSIKRQVVAGFMYHLHIKVREYRLGGFDKVRKCRVKVWVQGFSRVVHENSCL